MADISVSKTQTDACNSAVLSYLLHFSPQAASIFAADTNIPNPSSHRPDPSSLLSRWVATSRLQLKVSSAEKRCTELREKLKLFEKETTYETHVEGLPISPPSRVFIAHSDSITSIAFHPMLDSFITGSEDGFYKVWDYESDPPKEKNKVLAHNACITDLALSSVGNQVATASLDTTVKVWDFFSSDLLQTFRGHSQSVSSVTFAMQDSVLLSASKDKTVRFWNLITGEGGYEIGSHTDWVRCVASNGEFAVSCGSDKRLALYKLKEGSPVEISVTTEIHTHVVQFCVFVALTAQVFVASLFGLPPEKADSLVLTASRDKTFKLWHAGSGTELQHYVGHHGWVVAVRTHLNGNFFASCSDDQTIRTWNIFSGECLTILTTTSQKFLTSLAIRSDPFLLASASASGGVEIWACRDKQAIPDEK